MKKIILLTVFAIFTLSSVSNAQFGSIANKIKKKVDKNVQKTEKSVEQTNDKVGGGWYIHAGQIHDHYNPTKTAQHDIFGPKSVEELKNTRHKVNFSGKTLVSRTKDSSSFKPAMQYPELREIVMEANDIPSIPTFYFATKPIDPNNPGANAKENFSNNERIYGMVKFDRPLKDFLGADVSRLPDKPYFLMQYTVTPFQERQSVVPGSNPMFIKKEDLEKDYLMFDLIPDVSNATREFKRESLQSFLGRIGDAPKSTIDELGPVKAVRIDIIGWDKELSHQIGVDLDTYDVKKLAADAELVDKKTKNN